MKLFIDCEFTNLDSNNKLISIALVDENEEYFYSELSDTYRLSDCSVFVKNFVLPYLIGGKYNMSFSDCSKQIRAWIQARGPHCILACDNPTWDIPHLRSLLGDSWPDNLRKDMIYPIHVPHNIEERLVLEYGYCIHNALDDALVMKKAIDMQQITLCDK